MSVYVFAGLLQIGTLPDQMTASAASILHESTVQPALPMANGSESFAESEAVSMIPQTILLPCNGVC